MGQGIVLTPGVLDGGGVTGVGVGAGGWVAGEAGGWVAGVVGGWLAGGWVAGVVGGGVAGGWVAGGWVAGVVAGEGVIEVVVVGDGGSMPGKVVPDC